MLCSVGRVPGHFIHKAREHKAATKTAKMKGGSGVTTNESSTDVVTNIAVEPSEDNSDKPTEQPEDSTATTDTSSIPDEKGGWSVHTVFLKLRNALFVR